MRVALCTIVRKFLEDNGIFIGSHVLSIGQARMKNHSKFDRMIKTTITLSPLGAYKVAEEADKSVVRMLDTSAEEDAVKEIKNAKKAGDTLGGIFEVIISGTPVGLGSYVQQDRKLDGQLVQAMMSIQAIKGVEIGEGFTNALNYGSQVHDEFTVNEKKIGRGSNRAGGLEGGITNGELIIVRAAMKPIATLAKPLKAVDLATNKIVESRYERSDVCAVPAASVIGEAVVAPVIANAFLEKYGGDSMTEISKRY
jgi:chorismate synthase